MSAHIPTPSAETSAVSEPDVASEADVPCEAEVASETLGTSETAGAAAEAAETDRTTATVGAAGTCGTPEADRIAGAAGAAGAAGVAGVAGAAGVAGVTGAAGVAATAGTPETVGTAVTGGPVGPPAPGGTDRTAVTTGTAGTAATGGSNGSNGSAESAEVRRFWQDLGLPGLVDVHTHFMPERVLHKVWAYFDGLGPLTGGVEWPITYREDEAERAALLRAFGVRAFTAMLYPHKPGMARWLNDWAVGFARRTPDCLHTSTFFPEPGAAAYVREAVEHGTRVFKAHVQVGGYDPADEALDACWGLLAEAGTPVVVHCGSGPAPGKHTGPGPMARVLARHPRLRVVVAHLGMPEYEDFLDLAERYPEVRLDTTMAFTGFSERMAPFPRRALPRLAALGDRVLLGTDFPNIPYPYAHQLDALAGLGLGDDWLRAVCHDNAARLFGLPDAPEPPA